MWIFCGTCPYSKRKIWTQFIKAVHHWFIENDLSHEGYIFFKSFTPSFMDWHMTSTDIINLGWTLPTKHQHCTFWKGNLLSPFLFSCFGVRRVFVCVSCSVTQKHLISVDFGGEKNNKKKMFKRIHVTFLFDTAQGQPGLSVCALSVICNWTSV